MLQSVKEILLKSSKCPLGMEYVISWLDKNKEQYNKIKRISQVTDLFEIDKGLVRLPMDIKGTSEDDQFLEIYGKLTELKKFYDMEAYFKNELNHYATIRSNKELLQEFYLRNKEKYDKDVFSFFVEYYDDIDAKFLDIYLISINQSLRLNPASFQNLLTFSETFKNTFNYNI